MWIESSCKEAHAYVCCATLVVKASVKDSMSCTLNCPDETLISHFSRMRYISCYSTKEMTLTDETWTLRNNNNENIKDCLPRKTFDKNVAQKNFEFYPAIMNEEELTHENFKN